ncbi:MAG: aldehyde dehydrogenase [Anaerovoracaceae bacterium]
MEIKEIVRKQREFFQSGETLDIKKRKAGLLKLKESIKVMEQEILEGLKQDLGKSRIESYMSEVGMALEEITYMVKHIDRFAKDKRARTPLAQFSATSYKKPCPYGVVLIMSPWNYPFLLTIGPLIDALAAGNTAVLKPSNYSGETSKVMTRLMERTFPKELVCMVEGGREANTLLLEEKFNYIFFTGGKTVGRLVMEKAAKHLTPVSLELGGKSPCMVNEDANLKIAARRIVFGKFLNLGQTCVAPDYLLVHNKVKNQLVMHIQEEITKQFGKSPLDNPDYGHIINEKHTQRLKGLLEGENPAIGGQITDHGKIAPTVITDVTMESPLMREEIFGPILPVIGFETWKEALRIVGSNPEPLAFYLFTKNKELINRVTKRVPFGGGCINDTVIHLATTNMGFGGMGESGMGSYHGKVGFDTFTHYKSIVDKKTWLDLPFRYQPYTLKKEKMIRKFLK